MPEQVPRTTSAASEIRGGRVIVAAFEPFEGRAINRSWEAVRLARGDFERVQLPVVFARLPERITELARRADALLLVGEAKRDALSIERRAQNRIACRIADNAGDKPDGPIDPAGPAELAASWPLDRVLAAARADGAPAEFSDDAGGFCCNAALYHALRAAPPAARVGFLHVPIDDAIPLDALARAIEAIVATMRD